MNITVTQELNEYTKTILRLSSNDVDKYVLAMIKDLEQKNKELTKELESANRQIEELMGM